jgi:hypothetical protein
MQMNFGMRHWEYQSFLVLPTDPENAAQPGSTITATKWAKGKLYLEDTIDDDPDAVGTLVFPTPRSSIKLAVKVVLKEESESANFEAIGKVEDNTSPDNGACYILVGWASQDVDGRVNKITGSVRALRGSNAQPDRELGQMPIGTVGLFTITNPRSLDEV